VGANTLSRDNFGAGMRAKYANLVAQQQALTTNFKAYSSEELIAFHDKILSGSDIDEVNRIRAKLLKADEVGGFGVDSIYWFDTITQKINLLKSVEDYIRDDLLKNKKADKRIKDAIKVSSALSNFIHETQKERGATAGFLGSKGTKFTQKLPNQRKLTDKRLSYLNTLVSKINFDNFDNDYIKNLKDVQKKLKNLSSIRSRVDSQSITAKEAIKYYTSVNSNALTTIAKTAKMSNHKYLTKDIISFYNFLMSKERAGIERAVMSNTFARNKFLPGMKDKFITLIIEQDSFMKIFQAISKSKYTAKYNSILDKKPIKEVQKMRLIAINAHSIGGFNEDPKHWFAQITSKINKLKKIDDYLGEKIHKEINKIYDNASTYLNFIYISNIVSFIIVAFLGFFIPKRISDSIIKFQKDLSYYFKYVVREKEYIKSLSISGTDEIAQMATEVNQNIQKTQDLIEQDKKVVIEIDDVMQKVSMGFFGYNIKQKGATQEVEILRQSINKMLIVSKSTNILGS
jgi:methyl-accepting chemotaxis protein